MRTPKPEVGTRLAKELGKLLLALAAVRGKAQPDEEDFETVARVADDCLPSNRVAVIESIRRSDEPLQDYRLGPMTRLPKTTLARTLGDLEILGAIEYNEDANGSRLIYGEE